MKKKLLINLQLFGEGGDGAGTAGTATGATTNTTEGMGESNDAVAAKPQKGRKENPLASVVYGKQEEETTVQDDNAQEKTPETFVDTKETADHSTAFENLIKNEYKDEFSKRTQEIIDKRFKETKNLESQVKMVQPVLDILAQKYGVEATDLEKLAKAVQEDDAFYSEEADKLGISVTQLKQMRRLERENAELTRAQKDIEMRTSANNIYAGWMKESDSLKEIYPSFDFATESQNDQFTGLLKSGIDVKTAYEVIHKDEIIGGAMYHTAQTVKEKLANSIQNKASRPAENGMSQQAVTMKTDVNSLTKKDREEIERRVMRGEKIVF